MKLRTYALVAASLLAACDSSTNPPGPPAALLAVGNTAVALTVGTTAADSLGVKVVDEDGRAVPNAQVSWTVDAPGGVIVSPVTATTNAQGVARVAVQGGTAAGTRTVRAAVAGSAAAVSLPFAITQNPGPVATLQLPPLATLTPGGATTLAVTAADQYGNATATTGATWTSSLPAVAGVSTTGGVSAAGVGTSVVTVRIGQATAVTQVRVVPATLNACETNTRTLCSAWTFSNGKYDAQWDQGSRAVIQVERFDADSVRFTRQDPSGSSAGLTAVYRAARGTAGVQNGVVTWTQPGGSPFSGTWYGSW
ncbi:MAG TPA: Ig-like domain-containing protein [Longimicrobium sp.]|nr:Ig-like domain-containing protein [Longimicrobium sp.]